VCRCVACVDGFERPRYKRSNQVEEAALFVRTSTGLYACTHHRSLAGSYLYRLAFNAGGLLAGDLGAPVGCEFGIAAFGEG